MKRAESKLFSLVLLCMALLWIVVVLIFKRPQEDTFYYWGGFAFGLISLLIGAAVEGFVKYKSNKETTEIMMLPEYVSLVYCIFGIIFNYIFVTKKDGDMGEIIAIGNVLAMLVYFAAVCLLIRYAARVTDASDKLENQILQYGKIKEIISEILVLCKEPEIKKEALVLKQKINAANNMSQEITVEEEKRLYGQLREIKRMLEESAEKDEIVKQIEEAKQTIALRNSKLASKN